MTALKQIKSELLSEMGDLEKEIVNDFINSFVSFFPGVLSSEELYSRINILKYIGFEKPDPYNRFSVSPSDNGCFIPGRAVCISNKYRSADIGTIKSVFYHELIHAISRHREIDADSKRKTVAERTGLNRMNFEPENLPNQEGKPFIEGNALDEIMVEYYANCLLKHEGITVANDFVFSSDAFEKEYVQSEGTGYLPMYGLGQIYSYFFGDLITRAMFTDGNDFRGYFNNNFANTGIFEEIPSEYNLSPYNKFVKENNPLERFKIASKMFIVLLKQKYQDKEVSSNELMNDPDLQIFINILMKHKTRLKGETKVTDEYYLMLQELELNILKNFRSDAIDSLNLNNSSGQVLVYVFYKKMLEGYPDLKPEDINYQEFYVNGFHGILVNVQGIEYILSSDLLEQNVQGAMMQNMDEPEMASVKYASLYTVGYGNITIMKKDNKWYDYNGDILHFSETHSLISDKDKDKTLDNNINRSRLLSTDTGFISIINLLTLIVMAISITIWIYLKIG